MASGQHNFRKAIGAIKDSTKVGLAKVNSDYKALDVAIIKATYHDEVLSKEKHIRTIMQSLSASRPRGDVAYCLHSLARRLAKTRNWAVALKTLIIIHRAMRDADPSIREVLVFSKIKNHMINLSNFKDDSSRNAWDCATWVRSYALYLDERLECFRRLKYDIQNDRMRTQELDTSELFNQLPPLQLLLFRLICCRPVGTARSNCIIQYALSLIAAESVSIYVAISNGVLKLVDKFFEMKHTDAVRALDIYRKSADQADWLSEFYEICGSLEFGRGKQYIKIEKPPESFIVSMEEHVKEYPQKLALPWRTDDDKKNPTRENATNNSDLDNDHKEDNGPEEKPDTSLISLESPEHENSEAVVDPAFTDLLGSDDLTQEPSELIDDNPLALAIVPSENPPNSSSSSTLGCQPNSWELALFTAPSSNDAAISQSKLGGGLDRLTLDSLYDNAVATTYYTGESGSNPFETMGHNQDPFFAPSNMAPQTNMQMGQQHDPTNPFGNPFLDHDVSSNSSQSPCSSPFTNQSQDGSPYSASSPYGSPYPAQSLGVLTFSGQTMGAGLFSGQSPGDSQYPGQSMGGLAFPGQNTAGLTISGQSPRDSQYPGQSIGGSTSPGQNTGGLTFSGQSPRESQYPGQSMGGLTSPGQNTGGLTFSGQSPRESQYPGQSMGGLTSPGQNTGGLTFSGQSPRESQYPGQSTGGLTFKGHNTGGLTFSGPSPHDFQFPGHSTGSLTFPGQNTGGLIFSGQSLQDSQYPGQSTGDLTFPGQNTGELTFSSQSMSGSPLPSQGTGGSHFTGQSQGVSPNPNQNQDPFAGLIKF